MVLTTTLNFTNRIRWEVIERYSENLTIEDIPELKNSLDRIENEARSRGVIGNNEILYLFSEDPEAIHKIKDILIHWTVMRNDKKNGKLDLAIKNKNVDQIKSILKIVSKINRELMDLVIQRMKLLM